MRSQVLSIAKLLALLWLLAVGTAQAQQQRAYLLGPGDVIRITVFQNVDMTTDTRVSDQGMVTFPLIGSINVGGGTTTQAEQKIAAALKSGGFVKQPQVNVVVQQFRFRQVSVLGYVGRPGRYPMEDQTLRLADVLSMAGGTAMAAADQLFVIRMVDGKEQRFVVDLEAAVAHSDLDKNFEIFPGDTVYVPKQSYIYIYGQVNRPGQYRFERNMTVMQGLAVGGGVTLRGTEKGLTVRRRESGGKVETLNAGLQDKLQPDDVIYVRESVF
ncbi:MAG: polysaccharide export protein EpsE [Burkholderiales bacterium]